MVFSVAREAVWEETARAPSAVWPALPDDDGLSLAYVLENFEEASAVLDALHIHADHLGLGVLAEVFEVVRDVEDDGVAQAHQLADLDAVRPPEQAEVHALGAALADEADRSRPRRRTAGW